MGDKGGQGRLSFLSRALGPVSGSLFALSSGAGFWQPEGNTSGSYGYTSKDEERQVKAPGEVQNASPYQGANNPPSITYG